MGQSIHLKIYVPLLIFLTCCMTNEEWQEEVSYHNGRKTITNTEKGIQPGENLKLKWRIPENPDKETTAAGLFGGIVWIEFDPENNLYVLDHLDQSITKLSPERKVLFRFGSKGQGPGQLRNCTRFVWADGFLFVANRGNNRIEVFDENGKYHQSIRLDECKSPSRIYFRSGFFYVSERNFDEKHPIYKYDKSWQLIGKITSNEKMVEQLDYLRLRNDTRIAEDGFWVVYLVDNRIQKIDWESVVLFETSRKLDWDLPRDPAGRLIPEFPIHRAFDVDPNGDLYIIYSNPKNWRRGNDVYKYGADGRLHGYMFTLPIENATMIRFDDDGSFYFADGVSLYKAELIIREPKQ